MLSDVEVQKYHEDGYVIPDFRLPEETLEEIRGAHGRLLSKHPEFRDYCSCLLAYDTGFLNVARNPDILDMVAQLIGPDFALWNSSFFAKPAGNGKRTPWHQDGEYWPIRPVGDLHGLDRGRCRDAGERLPSRDPGLAPGAPAAPAPHRRARRT